MTFEVWLLLAAAALIGSIIGITRTLYLFYVPLRVQVVIAMAQVVVLIGVLAALVVSVATK